MQEELSTGNIEHFLPLGTMTALADVLSLQYKSAKPFPHVVVDDLFSEEVLEKVVQEFPERDWSHWFKYGNSRSIKLSCSSELQIPEFTRNFLLNLNSSTFLCFLERVTGINGLVSDPHFDGGGLHQICRGGNLKIHADYNKHRKLNLDRRLNLLLYLNKNWHEEYGGHLELWNRGMTACEKRLTPIFNRMVVFGTTDYTYHGHPDALACPKHITRKSLALYYFSNGRPREEISEAHGTTFQSRPSEKVDRTAGEIARDFVPPIMLRAAKRVRNYCMSSDV